MSSQVTLAEAAELLGASISDIQRLITLGRLQFQQVCLGRCELLVSRDSFMALVRGSHRLPPGIVIAPNFVSTLTR